jgi:putative membrane protein
VDDQAFEPQERLHPTSWLFTTFALVRQFIVPIVAALLFGARNDGPPWLGYVAIPLIAGAIWKQYFYRYGLGPTGLVIREGLFFKNVRQIDYARIENIDTERSLLHRLLGVAEVRVETSTGGRPEALIQVLGLQAAEALRRQVFASRGQEARPTAVNEEVLLHMPTAELVKFGLIDNRGMIVVAGLFGLIHQSGAFDVLGALIKAQLSEVLLNEIVASGPVIQGALALSVLIFALILVRAFSVVLALVTLHDFKLVRVGADLRARYGLLTRIAVTLRLRRIQAAHVTDTVLHRLFRRVSVRVDLAGDTESGQSGGNDGHSKVRWLAPLAEPRYARELIAKALPSVDFGAAADWQPLAPRARRRVFRRSLLIWLLLTLVLAVMLRTYWALSLLLVGIAMSAWYATKFVRYTRWALQPDALFFRYGWLTRKLVIVPRNRVQVVCLKESPFDRRHRMASVTVDTAGAGVGSDTIRVPYLELEVARTLAAALNETAAVAEIEHGEERTGALGATAV